MISREHVREVRTSKHRMFRKQMLVSEGIWPQILSRPELDLTSAMSILSFLKEKQELVIILCEAFHEWTTEHCRIEQVTSSHVATVGIHGDGKWEGKPNVIDCTEITQRRFGSAYLELYRKYASR